MMTNNEGNGQSHTYSRDWLVNDVYHRTHSKPKSGVIFLKMDSGDAWFANTFVNGTSFKFLMDTGKAKVSCLRNDSCLFQRCFDHNYTIRK